MMVVMVAAMMMMTMMMLEDHLGCINPGSGPHIMVDDSSNIRESGDGRRHQRNSGDSGS